MYPAASQFVERWFPVKERGKANSIIFAGVGLGSVVSFPLVYRDHPAPRMAHVFRIQRVRGRGGWTGVVFRGSRHSGAACVRR